MPDANGRIKGISVPRIPWLERKEVRDFRVIEFDCDCNIPILEGAGQHAPGCSIFKDAVLTAVDVADGEQTGTYVTCERRDGEWVEVNRWCEHKVCDLCGQCLHCGEVVEVKDNVLAYYSFTSETRCGHDVPRKAA